MGKRFRELTQTATDSDFVEGNYFGVDTPSVTKKVPANLIAKQSSVAALQTRTVNIAASIAPEYDGNIGAVAENLYMHEDSLYICKENTSGQWDGSKFTAIPVSDAFIKRKAWPIEWTAGFFNALGELVGSDAWKISDYIPIPSTGILVQNYTMKDIYGAYFDKDKNFLGLLTNDISSTAKNVFSIYNYSAPTGAVYVRVPTRGGYEGSTFAMVEDNISPLLVSPNNFNFQYNNVNTTWEIGKRIASNGNITDNSATGYTLSGYIKIPLSGLRYKIYIPISQRIAIYDKYKTLKYLIAPVSNGFLTGVIKRENFDFDAEYVRFSTSRQQDYFVVANEDISTLLNSSKFVGGLNKRQIDFIVHDELSNLIDVTLCTKNLLCQGGPSRKGEMDAISGDYWVTDFIKVTPETTYAYKDIYTMAYAFFDENMQWITGSNSTSETGDAGALSGGTFTTPQGARYARFSIVGSGKIDLAYVGERGRCEYRFDGSFELRGPSAENPCAYIGREVSMFEKGLAIGDSLTQGVFNDYSGLSQGNSAIIPKYSWPTQFEKMYGCRMTNMGVGGLSIEGWWQAKQNEDFSGHDFAVIALGVNNAVAAGTMWQQSTTDAMDGIINKLKTENKGIRIFICTTFHGSSYVNARFAEISQDIRDYVESLADPQVFLVDMYKYGTSDCAAFWNGHANATGYLRIAQDIGSYISSIILLNPDAFKDVQFINTDYQYNE